MLATEYGLVREDGAADARAKTLSSQFARSAVDVVVPLAPDLGSGYYRRLSPCLGIDVYVGDVTFREDVALVERAVRETFSLTFCLSGELEWRKVGERGGVRLERGDCCVYRNGAFAFENRYEASRRSFGMGIDLHPGRFGSVMRRLADRGFVADCREPSSCVKKVRPSRSIEPLVHDLLSCSYSHDLKALYLEGKVLEIVSALLSEVVPEAGSDGGACRPALAEVDALERVRRALDERCFEHVSVAELAKLSLMSESRLRSEFKLRYGTSVHQYLLDRRMVRACELLERGYRVKDSAAMAGYSNISHFGDQFKRRCGMTPGEYARRFRE